MTSLLRVYKYFVGRESRSSGKRIKCSVTNCNKHAQNRIAQRIMTQQAKMKNALQCQLRRKIGSEVRIIFLNIVIKLFHVYGQLKLMTPKLGVTGNKWIQFYILDCPDKILLQLLHPKFFLTLADICQLMQKVYLIIFFKNISILKPLCKNQQLQVYSSIICIFHFVAYKLQNLYAKKSVKHYL